jgi:hypothetical protein
MPITLNHSNINIQYSSDKSYIIETVKSDLYRRNEFNINNIVTNNIQTAPVTPTTFVDNSGNVYAVESYTYTGSANTADYTRVFTKSTTCDILIVGGGGGGGTDCGGGGGGGGVIYAKNVSISANTYTIKVGKGGAGMANGISSEAFGATANGGGSGGGGFRVSTTLSNNGGSGGGGGFVGTLQTRNGGTAGTNTIGSTLSLGNVNNYNGNVGGTCPGRLNSAGIGLAAGGGGAGSVGIEGINSSTTGLSNTFNNGKGKGGDGVPINITGQTYYWAAGGGGGTIDPILPGAGGRGGGGGGAQGFDSIDNPIEIYGGAGGLDGIQSAIAPTNTNVAEGGFGGYGAPNTGSGGGGGGYYYNKTGGSGGSGIVIIRYLLGTIPTTNILTTEPVYNLYDTSIYNHSGLNENQTSNIFIVSQNTLCDVLVVAGGGSGGNTGGGGGGGGDVLYFENVNFLANTLYNIYVGRGGQGRNRDHSTQGGGFNGNNSSIIGGNINIIAGGGGGGGGLSSSANSGTIANYTNPNTGLSAVSSGGGGGNTKDNVSASGNNVSGNGASNLNDNTAGGGGGGCGDVLSKGTGADAPNKTAGGLAGDGGIGYESTITGILRQFGGGGGGGDRSAPDSDKTGLGTHGGGNGTTTDLITDQQNLIGPDNGVNGTGGGGGGCGLTYTNTLGGNGGNGIVIIRQKKLEILNNIIRKITFAPFPTTLVYDFTPYTTLETWREYAYSIGAKTQINYIENNLVWTFPGGAKAGGIYGNGFISLKLHKNYKNLKVNYTAGVSFVELYINDVLNQTCPAGQAREFILLNYNENDVLKILEKESNFSRIIIITYSNPKDALYNINFPTKTVVNVNSGADIILEGSYDINIYTNNSCSMLPSSNNPFKLIKPYPLTSNISNISISYQILNPILDPIGAQWTYSSNNTNVYHMGRVGIGTTSPEYPLDVSGAIYSSLGGYTSSTLTKWSVLSDRRIKENIVKASYDKCLENVKNIELYNFNFKDNCVNTNDRHQLGFIAQEVQQVYPKAVEVSNMIMNLEQKIDDLLTLNITQIDYTLYGAVKSLIEKIENIKIKMEHIKTTYDIP